MFTVYVEINKVKDKEDTGIKELKEEINAKAKAGQDTLSDTKKLDALVEASEDQKAIRYFKSMEDGDSNALALWRRFRNLSIERYQRTYKRLNITFDEYAGESTVPREMIGAVSKELAEKKISEDSEGAVIVDFEKHGAKKLGKAILLRKDGTPLYLTRDIAEIRRRYDIHHFDKMIYVVASAQDLHLAQFFKVTEWSGHSEISERCEHINFGLVKGMSTRKGEVKFLDDILADVADKMHEVMKKNERKYEQVENPEQIADTLGITAVMVQDMKGKRINGYTFDINVSSFTTGPGFAPAMLTSPGHDLV